MGRVLCWVLSSHSCARTSTMRGSNNAWFHIFRRSSVGSSGKRPNSMRGALVIVEAASEAQAGSWSHDDRVEAGCEEGWLTPVIAPWASLSAAVGSI